jgi:hypothetical protein
MLKSGFSSQSNFISDEKDDSPVEEVDEVLAGLADDEEVDEAGVSGREGCVESEADGPAARSVCAVLIAAQAGR